MGDPKHIAEEALRLPPAERAALADKLLASLQPEVEDVSEAAWAADIERRAAADESNDVDWEDVRAEVDAKYGFKK